MVTHADPDATVHMLDSPENFHSMLAHFLRCVNPWHLNYGTSDHVNYIEYWHLLSFNIVQLRAAELHLNRGKQ